MESASKSMSSYIMRSQCVGCFISLHGKAVGRFWCGNNILYGNVQLHFSTLVLCVKDDILGV
jgi:hypothetical protein